MTMAHIGTLIPVTKKKLNGSAYKKLREAKQGAFIPTILSRFSFGVDYIVIEVQEFSDTAFRWRMIVNNKASDVYDSPSRSGTMGSIYHEGYVSHTEPMEGFDTLGDEKVMIDRFTPFRIFSSNIVNRATVGKNPTESENEFTEKERLAAE